MNQFKKIDQLCNIILKSKGMFFRKKWEACPAPGKQQIIKSDTSFKSRAKRKGLTEFRAYRECVYELTEQVAHMVPGIEKRGFRDHHVDHITSIWFGFKNKIPAYMIADLNNLRMLHHKLNLKKGTRCI